MNKPQSFFDLSVAEMVAGVIRLGEIQDKLPEGFGFSLGQQAYSVLGETIHNMVEHRKEKNIDEGVIAATIMAFCQGFLMGRKAKYSESYSNKTVEDLK